MNVATEVEQKNCSIKNRGSRDPSLEFCSFANLLSRLKNDFPQINFIDGKKFSFRPSRTIVVGPYEIDAEQLLLHELGHALLGHHDFGVDVERVKMECLAWEKAKQLAEVYDVKMDEDFIQDQLDTYRDWLHKKSRCPKCGLTRFQDEDSVYHCPRCEAFTKNN